MSFYPSNNLKDLVAEPSDLVFLTHTASTTQAITISNKVQLSSSVSKFGSWTPTISSDVITLDTGYYYYVQSAPQFYHSTGGTLGYVTHQHYNETSSSYIGTPGTCFSPGFEETASFSRDESCKLFIDCISSSVNISLKVTANTNQTHVNYNAVQYVYGGLGRTIIWRLNP